MSVCADCGHTLDTPQIVCTDCYLPKTPQAGSVRAPQGMFTDHLAHMRSVRTLAIGDHVTVIGTGRTGEISGLHKHHAGFLVMWDEPLFGVTESRIGAHLLRRIGQ